MAACAFGGLLVIKSARYISKLSRHMPLRQEELVVVVVLVMVMVVVAVSLPNTMLKY